MGCSASRPRKFSRTVVRTSNAIVIWTITPVEQETIRRTWRKLSQDIVVQGEKVIHRIFSLQPDTKLQFSQLHEYDKLKEEISIKVHGNRLIQAIGAVVDHVEDLDTTMAKLLVKLGKRHTRFEGFDATYFNVFSEAVIQIWGEHLKDKFKPDVKVAWQQVLGFMVAKMREGFQEARADALDRELTSRQE